jgi:hypothetical protein
MVRMAELTGGLGAAKVGNAQAFAARGFANCFDCSDQDALNATLEACHTVPFSILPRSAMAFESGEWLLPHAIGRDKPWRKNFLAEAAGGRPPTGADKVFWSSVNGPLRSMGSARRLRARLSLKIASVVSRFYRR